MNVYLFYLSNNRMWEYFPNSVLALANPLRKAGHNPVIVDTALQDWRAIDVSYPLFAGFSIYTDENIATALQIARSIRQRDPGIRLIWGGPHAIMKPEQTARHELVDAVCYGEGERSVAALAEALSAGRSDLSLVPGIIWKDDSGKLVVNKPAPYVNMDELDLYPYELLDEKLYALKSGKMYYEASRGCPFGCRFCSYDHTQWRRRSPERIIADLAVIERRFGPAEIQLVDANHFMHIPWVEAIWGEKVRRGLSFKWETNCRFDAMDRMGDETLRMLGRSGCYQLRFGAESGSQKILDYLNKGIKVEQIVRGVRRCRDHGIKPVLSFMMGYPPENEDDLDATLRLIDRLNDEFPGVEINGLFQFQPYPNTKIFEEITRTHSIPQPETLDGWAKYQIIEFHRTDFPWIDKKKYRQYVVLNSIVSYMFFAGRLLHMPAAQRPGVFRFPLFVWIFRLFDTLIKGTLVRLRWKRRVSAFPAEWYLWNFVRRRVLKLF